MKSNFIKNETRHNFNLINNEKLPIAFLNETDFSMGEIPDSVLLEDEPIYVQIPCYNTPEDLTIYLIDAKPESIWITKNNERRNLSLDKWQNGYSVGYAISLKEKIVVYWVVVW